MWSEERCRRAFQLGGAHMYKHLHRLKRMGDRHSEHFNSAVDVDR